MALATAKSDIAHHLHATLEQFGTVAIQDISRLFYATAAHVAVEHELVELSYDDRDHVFTLRHHNCFGVQLDETLGRIIRNYVAGESDAVTRFAECALGDPLDDDEVGSEQSDAHGEDHLPLTTHLVNFDGINTYGKAKAFHLRDLPPVLRNRALGRHNIEHLATTVSLRRVRLDPKDEQHIFGGSLGTQLPSLSSAEQDDIHWLLLTLSFAPFTRKITVPRQSDPGPEVERRRLVGKEPAIGQWLEGMGDTRQIDPEVQPEMGGEQFKFARSRTLQNDSLARVRKPKGVPLAEHQLPEGQPLEQLDTMPSAGFAALMRSDAIGDTSSEPDSSESGSDEVNPFEQMKSVKVVELAKSDNASTSGGVFTPLSTPQSQQHGVFTAATPATNAASFRALQTRSQFLAATPSSQGAPRSEGGFPNDGRSYAKADRWGLTGDAANHVAWEKENAVSLLSHRTRRAPRTYDELASTRAESVSGSGRDSRMEPPPIAAVTPMSYDETPLGGNEPWAENIVRPDIFVPMGTLVNTDETIADTSRSKAPQLPPDLVKTYASIADPSRPKPPQYPPGLYPALGSTEQQRPMFVGATNAARAHLGDPRPQHQAAPQTSGREASNRCAQEGLDLMSFKDADDSSKTKAQEDDRMLSFNDDDNAPFVEHGKAKDEELPRLHRTMRQQAGGKKKKHNKASTNRSTPSRPAVLELPSPPPPPPPPKPPAVVKPDAKVQVAAEPERSIHLEQVISDLFPSSSIDGENAGLEVRFGLALLTDAEDLIAERGIRTEDMQEKLDEPPPQNRTTIFQLVLGRQREDGVYLLRLPTKLLGSVSPYAGDARLLDAYLEEGPHSLSNRKLYEINIAVPGSHEWLLVFDQDAPEDVKISLLKDVQQKQSIYIHYPERVWDARIQARSIESKHPELDEDLERNIKTFLKTFDSTRGVSGGGAKTEALEGLPDFEAVVPDNAFIVTNVLAKCELTRNLMTRGDATSPSWVVSEVWDLHMQPSSLARAGSSSIVIFAKDEKTMRSQGRLWWEAALVYDKAPQEEGGLETLVDKIVAKLDSVGTPPVAAMKAKPDKAKKAKQEYVPYW